MRNLKSIRKELIEAIFRKLESGFSVADLIEISFGEVRYPLNRIFKDADHWCTWLRDSKGRNVFFRFTELAEGLSVDDLYAVHDVLEPPIAFPAKNLTQVEYDLLDRPIYAIDRKAGKSFLVSGMESNNNTLYLIIDLGED